MHVHAHPRKYARTRMHARTHFSYVRVRIMKGYTFTNTDLSCGRVRIMKGCTYPLNDRRSNLYLNSVHVDGDIYL